MNREVFLSLLALDSYNRGYGQSVLLNAGDSTSNQDEAGRNIGNATIIDVPLPSGSINVGFHAIAYDWNGETVISYRGTDNLMQDALTGYLTGAGFDCIQGDLAIAFYEDITGVPSIFGTTGGNVITTGHSLGGGLAGLVTTNDIGSRFARAAA
jgi:hypothetical protein